MKVSGAGLAERGVCEERGGTSTSGEERSGDFNCREWQPKINNNHHHHDFTLLQNSQHQ